jgi:transcriptional regulator with XRE-family HTH domain
MKTFGQYVRELRDKKDISLREFARKLDCSAAFISDVELGRRHPSDQVMAHMAKILGVPVEELQKYDTRPPIEDLRRKSEADPQYAFALRRIAEQDVTGKQMLKWLKGIENKKPRLGK